MKQYNVTINLAYSEIQRINKIFSSSTYTLEDILIVGLNEIEARLKQEKESNAEGKS